MTTRLPRVLVLILLIGGCQRLAVPEDLTAAPGTPLLVSAPGSPVRIEAGALATGDVNGDSLSDLLLVSEKQLKIFFGQREMMLREQPDVQSDLTTTGSEVVVADLNEDGNQDVVIADHNSYDVTVLLGGGDGRFQPAEGSPFVARDGQQPHTHGLVAADVNGDQHLDIVTANNADGDVSLLLGDGTGKYVRAATSPFACGTKPYPLAASDLNRDGFADLIIPNASFEDVKTLTVLLGSSEGELKPAAGTPIECDVTVWYVAAGDLNSDQRPDIVATQTEGYTGAVVLFNEGDSKFSEAPGSPLDFQHGAWCVEIADMNADGNQDLVVAADTSIRVLLGDGRGRFQAAPGTPLKTGKGAWRLVVGDFNGDQRPDIATRCVEANRLEVWLGRVD